MELRDKKKAEMYREGYMAFICEKKAPAVLDFFIKTGEISYVDAKGITSSS